MHAGKRTQIFRAIANEPAGKKNTREVFFFNNDIRIGLIVFQVNVEPGLIVLDKRVLQQKSIMLGTGNGKLNAPDKLHQPAGFMVIYILVEIRRHPLAQVFGLAHIQQLLGSPKVFITTRLMGYGSGNFRKFFFGHSSTEAAQKNRAINLIHPDL